MSKEWKKSSLCESDGCVEVGTVPACSGGECVEVSHTVGMIHVRNSTDQAKTVTFTRGEWDVFLAGVKAGDFDF